jgi:chromate transporter
MKKPPLQPFAETASLAAPHSRSVTQLFLIFLRIGATTYGGPLAGIASLQRELVERQALISAARYQEILTLVKLLPGPSATSMAVQMGRDIRGTPGGILAGLGFILPSFFLAILALQGMANLQDMAWFRDGFLLGARSGAWALVAFSLVPLSKTIERNRFSATLVLMAALLTYRHPSQEIWILLGAVLLSVLRHWGTGSSFRAREGASWFAAGSLLPGMISISGLLKPKALTLFGICFYAGAFTFGTGLAVLPVLQGEFVQNLQWLTSEDFLNALAIGQITPGPVLITASVLGYQILGFPGAVIATLGAFLPAFLYGLIIVPWAWNQVKNHPLIPAVMEGIFPAIVGAMGAVTLLLFPIPFSQEVLTTELWIQLAPLGLCAILAFFHRVPIWLWIPLSGTAGIGIQALKMAP